MTPTILPAGDSALVFQLGEEILPEVNARIAALAQVLTEHPVRGLREVVPAYRSLLILYDPEQIRGVALAETVRRIHARLGAAGAQGRLLTVPALYGGAVGQDLEDLARMKSMTPEEIVALHQGAEYRVYMIGFAPGFAYLGGLPERLHTPRLAAPRQMVPAGALGIGGAQASVNSVAGPSGWRYIGWTPAHSFVPDAPEPFLFRPGDRIRFRAIDRAEAEELSLRQARGERIVPVE
ncbi:MAG: 5-oxoprolinase subunit PxpB [Paenirhodobacter sp.]